MQKRDAIWEHPSLQSLLSERPLLLRQQLLEQVERARIVRLAQPEQRLFSNLRILVGSRDSDECGDTFVAGALRQCEYCLLANLAVDAIVENQRIEIGRCRVSRRLAEPENGLRARVPGQI